MKTKIILVLLVSVFFLFASSLFSLVIGGTSVDLSRAFMEDGTERKILLYERIPRTILSIITGAGLSVAGLVFQTIFRNPLADPYVIGVSGGAAIGASLAILLPISFIFGQIGVSITAFVFSLAAIMLTWALSKDRTHKVYEILLIGVMFNAFASAVIMFLKAIVKPEKTQEMLLWLMGTFSSDIRGLLPILSITLLIFASISFLYRLSPELNALILGEEEAMAVGVYPEKVIRWVFFSGSLLVACAVSVSGMIGFVGLIVPHIARLLVGSDHRFSMLFSAIFGGGFLACADMMSRTLFPVFETETPVGVLTALIGAPLFVILLKRHYKG